MLELSIVLPCLNEEHTIAAVLEKVLKVVASLDCATEILVVDNNSTDRSREIIAIFPVKMLVCPERGVGNALRYGLDRAAGKYLVFFDTDMSYDAGELPLLFASRTDASMIVGTRLAGIMEKGAMPLLHKYIGTPALTLLQNTLFSIKTTDANSGFRLFPKHLYEKMDIRATGMEFVPETTIKAALLGAPIKEIPIHYACDGRPGASHLRTFRDGWRQLMLMLLYAPKQAFALPGLLTMLAGHALLLILVIFPVSANILFLASTAFFLVAAGLQLTGLYLLAVLLHGEGSAFSFGRLPRICMIFLHAPATIFIAFLLIFTAFISHFCNGGPLLTAYLMLVGIQLLLLTVLFKTVHFFFEGKRLF